MRNEHIDNVTNCLPIFQIGINWQQSRFNNFCFVSELFFRVYARNVSIVVGCVLVQCVAWHRCVAVQLMQNNTTYINTIGNNTRQCNRNEGERQLANTFRPQIISVNVRVQSTYEYKPIERMHAHNVDVAYFLSLHTPRSPSSMTAWTPCHIFCVCVCVWMVHHRPETAAGLCWESSSAMRQTGNTSRVLICDVAPAAVITVLCLKSLPCIAQLHIRTESDSRAGRHSFSSWICASNRRTQCSITKRRKTK